MSNPRFVTHRFLVIGVLSLALGLFALLAAAAAPTPPGEFLKLETAIALAKEHNGLLKMAVFAQEQAEAKLKEARAQLWPSLDATLSYSATNSDPVDLALPVFETTSPSEPPIGYLTMPGLDTPPFSTSIALSQPLFVDPLRVQHEMARKTLELRNLEYRDALENMVYNVTGAYYQAVKAGLGREIAKRSLAQAEANLHTAQAQFAAGILTKNQVLQMELALANARQNLLRLANLQQLSLAGLRMQLGLSPDNPVEVAAEIAPSSQATPADPPLDKVGQRYDVQKAQLLRDMAGLGVRMAKSGYYPVASLLASYSTSGDSPTLSGGSTRITLALKWSYSLAGKTQATVKAAEADLGKAEEACRLAEEGGKLEIIQAHLELAEAVERTRLTLVALDLARENLRLATKRYELGAGTPQEAADAQLSLEQAEMNELNARCDLFLSGLKLTKALGLCHEGTAEDGKGK